MTAPVPTSLPTIWSYQDNLDFLRDIKPDDAFYEPLEGARGDYARREMLTKFALDGEGRLREGAKCKQYEAVLFGGHVGCGKSTELRSYAALFGKTYTVHHVEVTKVLDINNLRFSDLLMALGHALTQTQVNGGQLQLDATFVDPVINWFETRIVQNVRFRDAEINAELGARVEAGVSWLAKVYAQVTGKLRSGVSYKEDLRREIRDGFTELVGVFNALVAHANAQLARAGAGPLLFVLDGTDKLTPEDAKAFFEGDINQLTQVQTNLVICAPIQVLIPGHQFLNRFACVKLLMVKVANEDGTDRPEIDVLVKLVSRRLPIEHFDDPDTLRYLVRSSGGHVRDLLRLVGECFTYLDASPITLAIAQRAVKKIGTDYERLVGREEWADLAAIDASNGADKARTDVRLSMLYQLVLLEYNNYWWASHPTLRETSAYRAARQALQQAQQAAAPPGDA
jgi:energy-coupling factor transporter ATP-binding protein EcfA2